MLRPSRIVFPKDAGEVMPERSFRISLGGRPGASSKPTALVRTEPTAGAAFTPSIEPTLKRGLRDIEFDVERIDSVGLGGRMGRVCGKSLTVGVVDVVAFATRC